MDFSVNPYYWAGLGFPNCTQPTRCNSALSLLKTINTGGPQGCVFVPLVLYTNKCLNVGFLFSVQMTQP